MDRDSEVPGKIPPVDEPVERSLIQAEGIHEEITDSHEVSIWIIWF
jgi:hypothetical protein